MAKFKQGVERWEQNLSGPLANLCAYVHGQNRPSPAKNIERVDQEVESAEILNEGVREKLTETINSLI